jgi:hypothetical protein
VTGSPPAGDAQDADSTSLTAFQIEVARTFFELDAAHGFLLAGGAALAAQRMPPDPPTRPRPVHRARTRRRR